MNNLVIFGIGQQAENLWASLQGSKEYRVVGFTVDREYLQKTTLFDLPVVPFDAVMGLFPPQHYWMHIAASYRQVNRLRAEKFQAAWQLGYRMANLFSSDARIHDQATFGNNVVIGTQTIVDPFVSIGDDVHIASGCIIGHHAHIGDHCFLASGVIISGSVTVEPYGFFGAGAIVRDRIHVAQSCVIGAGAVILENTQPGGVYLAHPAEQLPLSSDQLPLG
jgi:sugar O-acyltransferase (sialic acid O-acetyltransferase NeuD family)